MSMLVRPRGGSRESDAVMRESIIQQPGPFYNGNPSSSIWGNPPRSPLWQGRSGMGKAPGAGVMQGEASQSRVSTTLQDSATACFQTAVTSPFAFGFPSQNDSIASVGYPSSASSSSFLNPSRSLSTAPQAELNKQLETESEYTAIPGPDAWAGIRSAVHKNPKSHTRAVDVGNVHILNGVSSEQRSNRFLNHVQVYAADLGTSAATGNNREHITGERNGPANSSGSKYWSACSALSQDEEDSASSSSPFCSTASSFSSVLRQNTILFGDARKSSESEFVSAKEGQPAVCEPFVFGLKVSVDAGKPPFSPSSEVACRPRAGKNRKSFVPAKCRNLFAGSGSSLPSRVPASHLGLENPSNAAKNEHSSSSSFVSPKPTRVSQSDLQSEVANVGISAPSPQFSAPTRLHPSFEMPKEMLNYAGSLTLEATEDMQRSKTFEISSDTGKVEGNSNVSHQVSSTTDSKVRVYQTGIQTQVQNELNRIKLSSVAISDPLESCEGHKVVTEEDCVSESAMLGIKTTLNRPSCLSGGGILFNSGQNDSDADKMSSTSSSHAFGKDWGGQESIAQHWPPSYLAKNSYCGADSECKHPEAVFESGPLKFPVTSSNGPFIFKASKSNSNVHSRIPDISVSSGTDVANSASVSDLPCTGIDCGSTPENVSIMQNDSFKKNGVGDDGQDSKIGNVKLSSFSSHPGETTFSDAFQDGQRFVFSVGSGHEKPFNNPFATRLCSDSDVNTRYEGTSFSTFGLTSFDKSPAPAQPSRVEDYIHQNIRSADTATKFQFFSSSSSPLFQSAGTVKKSTGLDSEKHKVGSIHPSSTSEASFVFQSTDKPRDHRVLRKKTNAFGPSNLGVKPVKHLLSRRKKTMASKIGASTIERKNSDEGSPMDCSPSMETEFQGSSFGKSTTANHPSKSTPSWYVPYEEDDSDEEEEEEDQDEAFKKYVRQITKEVDEVETLREAAADLSLGNEADLGCSADVADIKHLSGEFDKSNTYTPILSDDRSLKFESPATESRFQPDNDISNVPTKPDANTKGNHFAFSATIPQGQPMSTRRSNIRRVRHMKIPQKNSFVNLDFGFDSLPDTGKFEFGKNATLDIGVDDAGVTSAVARLSLQEPKEDVCPESSAASFKTKWDEFESQLSENYQTFTGLQKHNPTPMVSRPIDGSFTSDFKADGMGSSTMQAANVSTAEHVCEKWRIRGNEAYANGDFPKAEEYYSRGASCVSPNETSQRCIRALMLCYSNRAATRMAVGRVREALADCLRAMTVDPNFLRVRLRAASCHLSLGEIRAAISLFKECLKCSEGHPTEGKIRSDVADGLRKAQQVEEYIQRVYRLLDNHNFADASTALLLVNEALSSSPHSEELFQLKARALLILRRYPEAVQLCEQTLPSAERNWPIIGSESQMQESVGTIRDVSSNGVHYHSCKIWRQHVTAKALFHLGRLEDCLEALPPLDEVTIDTISDRWSLGAGYGGLSVSRFATLISDLLRHKAAGNQAFQAGRHGEAIEHYTAALACHGDSRAFNAVLFCNRAAASQALGQVADAIADCSRAVVLDPKYAKAISRRATLHEMIRDYGHACGDLRRLIDLLESKNETRKEVRVNQPENTSNMNQDLKQSYARLAKAEDESRRGHPLDYYQILGVDPSCSANEIKRSYRKLALRHHPDKAGQLLVRTEGGDDGDLWKEVGEEVCQDAERLFKLIGEAHAVLSDTSKRIQYENDEDIRKLRTKGSSAEFMSASESPHYYSERGGRRHRDRWDSWSGYTHQSQRWQSGPDAAQPDLYARRGRYRSNVKNSSRWEYVWNDS